MLSESRTVIYYILISLLTTSSLNICQAQHDNVVVVNSIKEILENKADNNLLLRTYNIKFTLGHNFLDTNDTQTLLFLDSLATFLRKGTFKEIEVGIHLSLKYSKNSSAKYPRMHSDIIDKLVDLGIGSKKLKGHNYLDSKPLILCNEGNESEIEDCYETEYKTNKRVEFFIRK